MKKPLVVIVFCFLFSLPLFAQEILTLTTYYPAPFGVYVEMRGKRMAIGDNYFQQSAYPWATTSLALGGEIALDTDLVVEGKVGIGTINPRAALELNGNIILAQNPGDPTAWAAGTPGEFAYSSTNDALYIYNGSVWVEQGGGGGRIKIAKAEGVNSATLECDDGWQIVKCAVGAMGGVNAAERARGYALLAYEGETTPAGFQCFWNAFGSKIYTHNYSGSRVAIIAQCAEQ